MISLLGSGDLLLNDQYFLVCDNLLLTHLRFFHRVLLISSRLLPTYRFLLLVQSGVLLVGISDNKINSGSRPLCLNDRHFFFSFSPSSGVLWSFLSLSLAIISPTAYPVI